MPGDALDFNLYPPHIIDEFVVGDFLHVITSYSIHYTKLYDGRVVWVTPRGAQGNRTAGIGVQFSEQDAQAIFVDRECSVFLTSGLAGSFHAVEGTKPYVI